MANPRFENVSQMEAVAASEADETCNLRLVALGFRNCWLEVNAEINNLNGNVEGYSYIHQTGRARYSVTREAAQHLIDIEWGKTDA